MIISKLSIGAKQTNNKHKYRGKIHQIKLFIEMIRYYHLHFFSTNELAEHEVRYQKKIT